MVGGNVTWIALTPSVADIIPLFNENEKALNINIITKTGAVTPVFWGIISAEMRLKKSRENDIFSIDKEQMF